MIRSLSVISSWSGKISARLGIFGGTFDPPHIGHLILAAEAQHQLRLDRVLWVLTPDPPHKTGQTITPLPARLERLIAALRDLPTFEISAVDMARQPPHYAVDTVARLQAQYPAARLIYLMGGDSLRDLPKWYRAPDFVAACHQIGVMRRPGDAVDMGRLETEIPGITPKVRFVEAPLLEIAASQIRARIRDQRPYRHHLPESVYQFILTHQLYQRQTAEGTDQ